MSAIKTERYLRDVTALNRCITRDESFLYDHKGETKRLMEGIQVHFLIFDPDSGHTIHKFIFRTPNAPKNYIEWSHYLRDKGIPAYATRILADKNTKDETDKRLVEMMCFEDAPARKGIRKRSGKRPGRSTGRNVKDGY